MRYLVLAVIIMSALTSHTFAASIEKAELLNKHGLTTDAKRELIDVIFDSKNANTKAEAYYLLGKIAYAEKNTAAAMDAWETIISRYPKSEFATSVSELIPQLSDALSQESHNLVDDLKARVYLRNGDFWSDGRRKIWGIDTSWLPHINSAIKWYDKTIAEFPKSEAARQAYIAKARTLIGWKEPGKYGNVFGLRRTRATHIYMPALIKTLEDFQRDFPSEIRSHQAIRYQIAQAYWKNQHWDKTREWLKRVIDTDDTGDSFYRDLAERRLNGKIEY